ncbi:cyclin-L2-like isoform X2 [Corticium candelabrum]|uniref:cyclin-L2-like isoform X2 n=1 Tax=Corticium candelabrum TaxID=121492 RepID=UPI002E2769A6|nr:cyclin-L2-like isoform X2 [Corticium candelabrum]
MAAERQRVVLSLDNVLLPEEKLKETPSMAHGLDREMETDLRMLSCEFIQAAGVLLRLPQVAMATAQVIFQRFYFSKSFVNHDFEHVSMASLFLAAKIEEAPRRIRDIINIFHFLKQKANGKATQPMDYMGTLYFSSKNSVIKAERRILKELGFCVHVKHPHKIIITYLQIIEHENNQELAQESWNFMNDSLKTDVFVRFTPETIACACIFLAGRQLQEISCTILEHYERPQRELSKLVEAVTEAKKQLEAKKTGVIVSSRDIETSNGLKTGSRTSSRTASPQAGSATGSKPTADKEDENYDTRKTDSQSRREAKSGDISPVVVSDRSSGSLSEENSRGSGDESSDSSPRVSQRSSPRPNTRDQLPRPSNRSRHARRNERNASPIRRHRQHRHRSRSRSRSRERRDRHPREGQRERFRDYNGDRRSGYGYERDKSRRDHYGKASYQDDKYRGKSKYR